MFILLFIKLRIDNLIKVRYKILHAIFIYYHDNRNYSTVTVTSKRYNTMTEYLQELLLQTNWRYISQELLFL